MKYTPTHLAKAMPEGSQGQPKDPLIRKLKVGLPPGPKAEVHTPAESWGFHLLIDCLDLDDSIDDPKDIEAFFEELISALDMKPLTEFFCVRVDNKEEGRGISAFQMITTSHIAMHFDDEGNNGFMDVFSCKEFDPKIVLKMIQKHFEPKKIMIQFVYRDPGIVIGPGDRNDYEMHNTL